MPTKAKDTQHSGLLKSMGTRIKTLFRWASTHVQCLKKKYTSLNTDYITIIRSRKISQIFPPSLIMLAIFLMITPFFVERVLNNDITIWSNDLRNEAETSIVPIPLSENEITQIIDYDENLGSISSIGLPLGTYKRLNTAEYEFILKRNEEVIFSQIFSSVFITDNGYQYFRFTPIELSESNTYSFTVRALTASEDNAIALYYDKETDDVVFLLGGRSFLYIFTIIAAVVFLIVFCWVNFLINSGKIKNELSFFICMAAYIIPLVFIYPAFTIPDEPYHFLSAVRLSEYDLAESPSSNLSRPEVSLPSNSRCLNLYFDNINTPNSFTLDEYLECFHSAPEAVDVYIEASRTSRTLAYLPSALGVMFGDLISDSPMIIFYCGRVFNLLTISSIIILALSLIKKHRLLLLAVIFIPMFLQQAISYSYDGLLNALCILVIAYGIRFLTMDVKIRKLDIIILAFALALIGLIKLPYILVAAPLLAVKAEKFGKCKFTKWAVIFALILIPALVYIFTVRIEAIGSINTSEAIGDSTRGFSLISLLTNPLATLGMFFRTLRDLGIFYITSTIGYFGWFYFSLDSIIIVFYLVFIAVIILSDSEPNLSKFTRLWIILAMVGLICSFFLVMYLQWTPKDSSVIEGVQGRYFLPAIPLFMLALTPKKNKINLPIDTCYTFFNLTTLYYVITLLVGFY